MQLKRLPCAGRDRGLRTRGKIVRPTVTATVPVGYADGLDRHLGCGRWSMLVAGRPAPIVGRICMDSCMIDVTDIPGVAEGDEAVVFSPVRGNDPETMARVLGTIPYEILTSVAGRVKRITSKRITHANMDGRYGTLYMIPCPISDETEPWDVLPAANRAVMDGLDYFIVENVRTARRFLSRAGIARPIDTLEFRELNEHTVAGRDVEGS